MTEDTGHVVLLSGGLDSTTLLYDLYYNYEYRNITALSFVYGQKHETKEMGCAKLHVNKLNINHEIVDLDFLKINTNLISALGSNSNIEVPKEAYDNTNRPVTYVPYRNALLGMIAASYAEAHDLHNIWLGVHANDAEAVYWDCSRSFVQTLNKISRLNKDFNLTFNAPYVTRTKARIAKYAKAISKKIKYKFYNDTWSCYVGGDVPCGKCGTCIDRINAFKEAGITD